MAEEPEVTVDTPTPGTGAPEGTPATPPAGTPAGTPAPEAEHAEGPEWAGTIDQVVPRAEQDAWHAEVASLIPDLPADVTPGLLDHAVRYAAEWERTWHSDATTGSTLPDPSDYEGSLTFVEHMWGEDFKANQKAVSTLITSWGPKAVEYFSTDIGNRPAVLATLLEISKGAFKLSAAEAQAEITRLQASPEFLKGGKAMTAKLRQLYVLAEGRPAPKSHTLPTPAPVKAPGPGPKGESLEQLQRAILAEPDRDVRTRLIAELRAIYQAQEGG